MQVDDVEWVEELREEGEVRFRLGRDRGHFIAEWIGVCTFRASRDGDESTLTPAPGADPELVDKLHRGLAKALVRHLKRKVTLHAAAVCFEGRAIGCLGQSEAGKSTLGAALARAGGAFVADDTLAIEFGADGAVFVMPTERVSWLLPDSCDALGARARESGKVPVDPPRLAEEAVRLEALVSLAFDDGLAEPTLRRLRGNEALSKVVSSTVRFVLDDPDRNRTELEQLVSLCEGVPLYELSRPRNLALLDRSVELLVGLARGERGKGP